jgi:hypothetical protein
VATFAVILERCTLEDALVKQSLSGGWRDPLKNADPRGPVKSPAVLSSGSYDLRETIGEMGTRKSRLTEGGAVGGWRAILLR